MVKEKVILKLAAVLFCLLALPSCDRSAKERDKAIAEAEKVKADLVAGRWYLVSRRLSPARPGLVLIDSSHLRHASTSLRMTERRGSRG